MIVGLIVRPVLKMLVFVVALQVAVVVQPSDSNQPFRWGLACADVSTGEFLVTERSGETELFQELVKLDISELLITETNQNLTTWWRDKK